MKINDLLPKRLKSVTRKHLRQAERDIQYLYRQIYRRDNPPPPYVYVPELRWVHVYELVDPRDGSVFYIGKGRPRRLQEHEQQAERGWLSAKCIRIRENDATITNNKPHGKWNDGIKAA